jgi:hypothetical protein
MSGGIRLPKAGAGESLLLASITGSRRVLDNSIRVLLQNIAVNYGVNKRSRQPNLFHQRC